MARRRSAPAREHPRHCECDRCLEKAMRRYADKQMRPGDYARKHRQRGTERTEWER